MSTITKDFSLERHAIRLEVSPEYLFMPNAVTRSFSKVVRINPGDRVFDIGSGVGPLAVWSALEPSNEVHAVEIVPAQYELLGRNVGRNGLRGKVRCYRGSFFEPIPAGLKANVIIADVSGIADGPARALGWYPPEIPTGGDDGTGVIVPLLEQAGPYLAEGGRLYFPVAVDLSASERIMDAARSKFGKLERVTRHNFPLTPEQVGAMGSFSDLPYVNLQKRGTRTTWRGEIYEATEPK